MTRLADSVHPRALAMLEDGPLATELVLHGVSVEFQPSAEQQAALEQLLAEQQRPGSPLYHRWLTPEQYAEQFGASPQTVAQTTAWLQSYGLTIDGVARSRTRLQVSGTTAQLGRAFRTSFRHYVEDGVRHFSNAGDLWLPDALAPLIGGVRNLNDFRPHPRLGQRPSALFTSHISGSHFLAPGDVATIYNIAPIYGLNVSGSTSATVDGTGHTLVVVGQSAINPTDIDAFRSAAGLGAKHLVQTLVPNTGSSQVVANDVDESSLDIEWSGAVAREATVNFVYSGSNQNNSVFDAVQYTVDNNLAPVISISYGICESQTTSSDRTSMVTLVNQANAQGQTLIAASGDAGAADCDSGSSISAASNGLQVDIPASLPQVTGIGGTTFTGDGSSGANAYWRYDSSVDIVNSALKYIPETAWNDSPPPATTPGQGLAASGGGRSTYFTKPSWQKGAGVPADGKRDVPDIAFAASPAHDAYLMCSGGSCVNGFRNNDQQTSLHAAGGTSFGAPVFAGILTLLEHYTGSTGEGNINPFLYNLAGSSLYSSVFHDVTTGNNIVPCTPSTPDCPASKQYGYSAGTGYDMVTGLGSLDVYALVQAHTTTLSAAPNPPTLGGSSTITATIAPALSGGAMPTGTVQFSVDGANAGNPVTLSGGSAAFSYTFADNQTHIFAAAYSGDALYPASSGTLTAGAGGGGGGGGSGGGGGGGGGAMPLAGLLGLGLAATLQRRRAVRRGKNRAGTTL